MSGAAGGFSHYSIPILTQKLQDYTVVIEVTALACTTVTSASGLSCCAKAALLLLLPGTPELSRNDKSYLTSDKHVFEVGKRIHCSAMWQHPQESSGDPLLSCLSRAVWESPGRNSF